MENLSCVDADNDGDDVGELVPQPINYFMGLQLDVNSGIQI